MINIKVQKPIICIGCDEKKKSLIGFFLINKIDDSIICKEYVCPKCFFDLVNLNEKVIEKARFKKYQLRKFRNKGIDVKDKELEKLKILSQGQFKIE